MGRARRVLLVEDELIDVMSVERAIRERRLEDRVDVVESAEEALERLALCGEGTGEAPPELIVTDLRLPLLSGVDLLKRVKADPRLRRIPVVILSTSHLESDVRAAYELGAAGYVVKPRSSGAFVDAMETVLSYWSLMERPSGARY